MVEVRQQDLVRYEVQGHGLHVQAGERLRQWLDAFHRVDQWLDEALKQLSSQLAIVSASPENPKQQVVLEQASRLVWWPERLYKTEDEQVTGSYLVRDNGHQVLREIGEDIVGVRQRVDPYLRMR